MDFFDSLKDIKAKMQKESANSAEFVAGLFDLDFSKEDIKERENRLVNEFEKYIQNEDIKRI